MSPHHFRIVTLGGFRLEGGSGEPAADALRKQRRKLAVLAVLALARAAVPRDTLIDMFWGEQEEARARHSLSEALSHLRRVLGRHAITARGADVALASAAPLAVDARELRAAVSAERWSDAVRLYGGPFLDGVHVADSARLEDWIAGERRELERLFLEACERECAVLRGAQHWDEAARVAGRWLDADPLSEAAALALLGALEAAGTEEAAARALRGYEALRLRLMRDYSAPPGARVQARAAVLAEQLAASPPALPMPLELEAPAASEPAAAPAGEAPRVRRARTWWLAGAVGALGVMAVLALVVKPWSRSPAAGTRVAVLPFTVRGSAEFAYLAEGVVDLLSADLDGAGPFHTVDPQAVLLAARAPARAGPAWAAEAARGLGAGLFVRGEIVVAGGRLRMTAGLHDAGAAGRRLAEATVDGSPDELFQLVDRLAAQLLSASGSPVPPLGRLAALTTSSLPALKAYLEGEADFRDGLYASAFEAFRLATELDTSFALAHYRVAQAANWAVPPGWAWDSILVRSRLAAAHADRLSPHARLLVDAYAAWVTGAYDDAERGYRAVVRTYPDDVEAWYGLGEVLFHSNPVRGRPSTEAGEPFARVLALEPGHLGALTHLLRVTLRQGQSARADLLVARLDALETAPRTAEFHALRAFAHGSEAERERALAELRASGNDELVRVTAHRVAVYARSLEGAARLLPLLLDEGLAPDVQAHAHVWLAQLHIAHGQWHAADRELAAAAALDTTVAVEQRALLAALPFAPTAAARLAGADSLLLRWQPEATPRTVYPWLAIYDGLHGILREYLLGLLAVRRGDLAAARRSAAALLRRGGRRESAELARGLGESLLGHAAAAAGRTDEALGHFAAARLRVSEGLLESQFGSQAYERWTRAELLQGQGRLREALPWYATLAETSIDALIYLAPAELRQAEILERLGDGRGAAPHYRRFVELWRDADPELAPWVTRAQSRLRALDRQD